MKVLVTGASGFIGSRLAVELAARGHDVLAMTRRPDSYTGAGTAVYGDVSDAGSLEAALRGVDVAYYLVHSLDATDFEDRDAAAATAFGAAAARQGVQRIVYLGGLGVDDGSLSAHLRSRRQVEDLLREGGVPVTVFRAAIVIGHGGISWELTRQLVARLPVMLTPRWVNTRCQPIALTDVVRYLAAALDSPAAENATFEIGGPDVLRYVDMLKIVAHLQNRRPLPVVSLPLLTPYLSSLWLSFVTDVEVHTARHLIDSMTNEVVVRDESFRALDPAPPLGFEDSVRAALAARAEALAQRPPIDPVLRRRRLVVLTTLLVGAVLLAISLAVVPPRSAAFYPFALGLAGVWIAGGLASGPLRLGRVRIAGELRRPVVPALVVGLAVSALFVLGALVTREVTFLREVADRVLSHARNGSALLVLPIALVNGVGEEIFFRGAVYSSITRNPVLFTTLIYTAVTIATWNVLLVFAAATFGTVLALQRRTSGGILAPIITHLTWSAVMLYSLPPLFA